MTPCFSSLSNSFSTCSCSAQGTLRAFLNGGCVSPLIIKWTSRPFIPFSVQFTRLANTVENENPVQHGILCCKQGTSPQELSSIVRLAGTKWKAYYGTQFADIVALESADAVCLAKGLRKGWKQLTLTMNYWKRNLWHAPSMVLVWWFLKVEGWPSNSR